MVDGDKLIPFIRQFYNERGEQGDQMMPLLLSLGQHSALVSVQAQLKEGERLFAFLDEIIHRLFACGGLRNSGEGTAWEDWRQHSPGQDEVVEQGWHQAINDRCFDARSPDGETRRWRGLGFAPASRDSRFLEYPSATLRSSQPRNRRCFLNEFRSLSTCKSGGGCSFQRSHESKLLTPDSSTRAEQHDQSALRCLSSILQMDGLRPHTHEAASMPLITGGLGV